MAAFPTSDQEDLQCVECCETITECTPNIQSLKPFFLQVLPEAFSLQRRARCRLLCTLNAKATLLKSLF